VLAVVAEIRDLEMVLSLPSNMAGHVALTEVSDPVTAAAERVAARAEADDARAAGQEEKEEEEEGEVELPDLRRLFAVGQVVVCAVVAARVNDGKPRLDLSLHPRRVNRGLSIEHLVPGYVRAAVPPATHPDDWGTPRQRHTRAHLCLCVCVCLYVCVCLPV
jgi:rRNA biogenesis protein RRP5